MAARTRAQDNGVSTKRLRRMATVRLEKFRNSSLAMRNAWTELEDTTLDVVFDKFDRAINELESDMADVLAYHDLQVGEEVGA